MIVRALRIHAGLFLTTKNHRLQVIAIIIKVQTKKKGKKNGKKK